ncbi:PTS sugar transporter subunit IIA [Enterococcus pingfangensis]|uniref:PTS sugar transporter subunit IIA n=1 Tax=Enterococcus pingfangensis TaxID=2559924 RepID=UPI0010F7B2EB|nr:PTS sugar transporter subunit IIA [Enterococcus pingfangensis]
MRNILIATHGSFASGIKGSLNLLIGDQSEISVIDAYIDDSDYTEKISQFFSNYQEEDEYFVFTDLLGGSVNQKMLVYKNQYDFHLITGFNLPILLEIVLAGNPLTILEIEEIVRRCRQELLLVNLEKSEDEEEFL